MERRLPNQLLNIFIMWFDIHLLVSDGADIIRFISD